MRKKKPLDIGEQVPFKQQRDFHPQPFPVLAAAIMILAAIMALALLAPPKSQAAAPDGAKIEIFLSGPSPFFENGSATARVFSSCGSFAVFLDGRKISEGASRADAVFAPRAGEHLLSAANEKCTSSVSFAVVRRECSANQSRPCNVGACLGKQKCAGGVFSECVLPRRICVPGEKAGCSLDSCQFGYMACNQCGTGFGECKPAETSNTANSIACPQI